MRIRIRFRIQLINFDADPNGRIRIFIWCGSGSRCRSRLPKWCESLRIRIHNTAHKGALLFCILMQRTVGVHAEHLLHRRPLPDVPAPLWADHHGGPGEGGQRNRGRQRGRHQRRQHRPHQGGRQHHRDQIWRWVGNSRERNWESKSMLSELWDPDSLNTDPDPAFQFKLILIWIRIQHFKWIQIRIRIQYGSGSRVLMTKNWRKKMQMKIFLIKSCNLLMSKLQEKTSALKREHPALQKMKFINFFLCLLVIFALLDPDPDLDTDPGTPLNSDPIRIRIRIHSTACYRSALPLFAD